MTASPVFDVEFENDILATALKDSDYLRRASPILEGHHLSTPEHTWVWEQLRSHHLKFKERIALPHLVARAKAEFRDEDALRETLEFVRKMVKRSAVAPKASLGELEAFTKTVGIHLLMEEGAKLLEKGETDKAYEVLDRAKHTKRVRDYQLVRWIEEFESRQDRRRILKEHPELLRYVATGFKKLDRIIRGVSPGELAMWMATTGVGKSIAMANILYNGAKDGKRGAVFSLEMPADQYAARLDARWLGMSYRKMKMYDFSSDELRAIDKRLAGAAKVFKNNVKILSMPLRAANVDWISSALDDLKAEDKFDPDFVIIDSGDHMQSKQKYDGQYRLQQAEIYWGLKGLALDRDIAIWSTTQAGKEWKGRRAGAEAASESYDKARIADLVISLNEPSKATRSTRSDDDGDDEGESETAEPSTPMSSPDAKMLEMLLAKYRDGESGILIPMEADFSKMLLHDIAMPEVGPPL